jgi:hypothetical protein
VLADVAEYVSWGDLTVSDGGVTGSAAVDGIFFDATPTFLESMEYLEQYEAYSKQVRASFTANSTVSFSTSPTLTCTRTHPPSSQVVYNPGALTSSLLYPSADYIVAFESAFSSLDVFALPTGDIAAKSAFIAYGTPDNSSTLEETVKALVPTFGAVYLTDLDIAVEDGASLILFDLLSLRC